MGAESVQPHTHTCDQRRGQSGPGYATGGTGVADRDVTPEAIRGILRVEIPGFGEAMRMKSLEITPNAILSRSLGALVDDSLVIALPGKPTGAVECLGFVEGAIPHSVKLAMKVPTSC